MEGTRQRPTRRWRIWVTLSVLVSVTGFGALLALQDVEQDARRQEFTARLYSANIAQTMRVLRPLGLELARNDPAMMRRLVRNVSGVLRGELRELRTIAPVQAGQVERALAQLDAFAEATQPDPQQMTVALLASARIANVVDAIAAQQHARAERAEQIRTFGGMGVLAAAVLLVGLLVHLDRRRVLEVERAQAATRAATAEVDALTGLPSRLRFGVDLAEHEASGVPVEVTVCDLNEFKEINHRLGYDAGDAVLITVGADLRAAVGREATVYRTGGDQFAVLSAPGAGTAERVREVLERDRARSLGCVGTACWPDDHASMREIVRLADHRMYAVKRVLAPAPVARDDAPAADAA